MATLYHVTYNADLPAGTPVSHSLVLKKCQKAPILFIQSIFIHSIEFFSLKKHFASSLIEIKTVMKNRLSTKENKITQ